LADRFSAIPRKMPLRHGGSLRAPVLEALGSADQVQDLCGVSVDIDRQG
jgi:hypothetical protein